MMSKLALRNLARNPGRNFATLSAVAAGFVAFMLASGYAVRVHNVLSKYTIYGLRTGHMTVVKKDALDHLAVRPAVWSLGVSDQETIIRALSQSSKVEKFGRLLKGQGILSNGCKTFPFLVTGVETELERYAMTHPDLLRWAPHLSKGRLGQPIWNYAEEENPLALSQGLAKLLGKRKVREEFSQASQLTLLDCQDENVVEHFADDANVQMAVGTWDGQLNALDGDVVQIFSTGLSETNNSSVVMNLSKAQNLYATDNVSSISVWLSDPQFVGNFIGELQRSIGPESNRFELIPWNDERVGPYYVGSMRFITTMVSFIGVVLAAVIILSIFNSATMTVIERSEEVGMLRSLGFSQSRVKFIFALEGFYLTAIGSLAGLVLGLVIMKLINGLEIHFNPPGVEGGLLLLFVPNFWISLWATGIVCSLGVAATYLAVKSVARRNISELVAGSHR